VGCSLATSLVARIKEIRKNINPSYLFIEPSEMVLTQEMLDATRMGMRDVAYQIGPFITLIDGPAFPQLWEERRPLLLGQIHKADLVAVSRADLLPPERLREAIESLNGYREYVFPLSVKLGLGLEEVIQKIAQFGT
jgi:G3E family GTPase